MSKSRVSAPSFEITREGVIFLLLLVLVLASFGRVPTLKFLNYDDPEYVTENPNVMGGISPAGLWWAAHAEVVGNWQPVALVSHQLDATLYGNSPFGHHLTNLLLHLANVAVVFWVLRAMTGAPWRSALVAALFAVHPLHVQSVAWVSARKDVLSTLFWLLTILAYIRYVRKPGALRYGVMAALFALGLMTKSMLVTLPVTLLILDFWPLKRWPGETETWRNALPQAWPLVREKAPLFALAVLAGIIAILTQEHMGALVSSTAYPIPVRISNSVMAYALYLYKMIWPAGLAVFYPYTPHIPVWHLLAAGAVLLAITAATLWYARRHPYILAGWLWYVVTLAPVIGLVQVGGQSMADRYTYVSLIGIFVIVAWGLADLAGTNLKAHAIVGVACAAIVATCGFRTWTELGYWKDSEALWSRALAVTTDNFPANVNIASVDVERGRLEAAQGHLETALRIVPNEPTASASLAYVLFARGRTEDALKQFESALTVTPDDPTLHVMYAATLRKSGRLPEANEQLAEVRRLDPNIDVLAILRKAAAISAKAK